DDTASGKAAKAKFAVAGKSGKADDNLLVVNEAGTKVYVDDDGTKAAKAKFAVAGKSGGKANNTNPNYLTIDNESTRIYIDEAPAGSKAAKSGFAVAGKSGGKAGEQNLFNIDLTQTAEVINDENRVFWYPKKNAFLAGRLNVTSADSVGENSFNAGYQNKAIGNYSQALGFQSRAKGEYATAIGKNANANKDNAYAFGNNAKASGAGSYAIGADAIATGMSSFAIGSVGQDSLNNPLPSAKATADYAYAVGAGTVSSAKGSLATGVNTEASGDFSTAMGYMVKATAYGSVAIGTGHIDRYTNGTEKSFYTTASGKYSTAIGYETYANGDGSVALGYRTTSGNYSFSAGGSSSALGQGSVALGSNCYAKRNNAVAIGTSVRATGEGAVAIGRGYAYGKAGQVYWRAEASGYYSITMGYATSAPSCCETAIGTFNTTYTPLDTVIFNASDRLFVVGNGTRYTDKSDALIVYKNGNMTVNGTITHSGLVGPSDIRLKKDIQTLNGALDKVLQLRGVSFYWKNKEEMAAAKGKDVNNFSYGFDSEKQIGVIAQEIEKVVPELVVTDNDGFKAVKYENLTPLLIEAIKEQNKKIEELESKLKEMDDLKRMVEELMKKQ
ncbi:MAG: tail fiber domain-containing protein, partial [Salinivirgaceae bacterium]|nr:tail fiber domain-containing protein [Salinivirgaceae bacterium]